MCEGCRTVPMGTLEDESFVMVFETKFGRDDDDREHLTQTKAIAKMAAMPPKTLPTIMPTKTASTSPEQE